MQSGIRGGRYDRHFISVQHARKALASLVLAREFGSLLLRSVRGYAIENHSLKTM
jgi:hypothetical protein